MTTQLTKKQVMADTRHSSEIDVAKEPNVYFALLAFEYNGCDIRDNSIEEWIEIGMEIERGDA